MQCRALHSDEFRRARDIAREPADLGDQVVAFEHFAGLAQRQRDVDGLLDEHAGVAFGLQHRQPLGVRLPDVRDDADLGACDLGEFGDRIAVMSNGNDNAKYANRRNISLAEANEFKRTSSRLIEMSSESYLALPNQI